MKNFVISVGLVASLGILGCQGEAEMSKKETETLSDSLNKPVDVDKIRADYAKQQGGKPAESAAAEGM